MPPGMMPPGMRPPAPGPPPPPPSGSGENYTWKQDDDEIEVAISVPNNTTKQAVKVVIQTQALRVEHGGAVILGGRLAGSCRPEEEEGIGCPRPDIAVEEDCAAPGPLSPEAK